VTPFQASNLYRAGRVDRRLFDSEPLLFISLNSLSFLYALLLILCHIEVYFSLVLQFPPKIRDTCKKHSSNLPHRSQALVLAKKNDYRRVDFEASEVNMQQPKVGQSHRKTYLATPFRRQEDTHNVPPNSEGEWYYMSAPFAHVYASLRYSSLGGNVLDVVISKLP